MKKHNEGYVLVYVTVVLILFSLIGSMILTSAMKNLNAQQAAITQMQDKYAAQGMIEKVLAQLEACGSMTIWDFTETYEDNPTIVGELSVAVSIDDIDGDSQNETILTLSANRGTANIVCTLILTAGNAKNVEKSSGENTLKGVEITELTKYEYYAYQIGGVTQ